MASEPETANSQGLQRKLTTILSGDVAAYSRLMAEDEEATLATFRDHKQVFEQLVAHHRGRVFNTAGDAILAEFSSAVEAVRCATEIQAALGTRNDQLPPARRVQFRLGVNLGDVMVHGTDLLGDGVNVAARLQAFAEPGGICISGSVYDQIRNKLSLSFRALGDQTFKNIGQPVRTFSITGSEGQGALPSPRAPRRGGALHRLVAALVLLLAIGAAYWGYAQYRTSSVEQARVLAAAEAARQDAERREAQLATEKAAADVARRLAEAALKQQEASRPAPPQPARPANQAAAVPRTTAGSGGDEVYAGPLCYGPGPNDEARCFRAQSTVGGGKIAGRWPGGQPGTTVIVAGEVSVSGDAKIEIHGEKADGGRIFTINLTGTLRDGKLDATGSFLNGRTATLNWQRAGG